MPWNGLKNKVIRHSVYCDYLHESNEFNWRLFKYVF